MITLLYPDLDEYEANEQRRIESLAKNAPKNQILVKVFKSKRYSF